jgi:plastocyanin
MSIPDPETALLPEKSSRRRLLLGLAGGAGSFAALSAFGNLPHVLGFAHDGHDHGEDEDDKDKSDDHSGHGGGGDHDGHDSDDDDVAIVGDAPAGTTEVRIVDDDADGFSPGSVTIDAGQSVTFTNADDDAHTATGADFDTGIIQPGDMVTVEFDTAGTFPYSCQIHPEMTGAIVVREASGTPVASPEAATPAASPASGGDQVVTIQNFAFDPADLTVAPGTKVTWVNKDAAPHTATGLDRAVLQSGTLKTGDSFSQVFNTPGTYEYFCEFHPNMKGTITVQ